MARRFNDEERKRVEELEYIPMIRTSSAVHIPPENAQRIVRAAEKIGCLRKDGTLPPKACRPRGNSPRRK